MIVAFFCTVMLFVFAVPVSQFFINDAETIDYSQHFLRIICISCPAISITTLVITIFQATGQKVQPTILSVVKRGVVDVILMYIMNRLMGVNGIPWATFIADYIAMTVAIILFIPYWKKIKTTEEKIENVQKTSVEQFSQPTIVPATQMIVTIGRSYGSGGRTVGKMVAKQLGIPYYDSELLEKAAEKNGLNKKFLESMDEKSLSLGMLYGYSGFVSGQYMQIEKMASAAQKEIIEEVADKGACVIVGRRADQILKGRENLFRVFITAPYETRVKRIMERDNLSTHDSKEKIKEVDKERADYYSNFADACWGNASNYDLCIDTDRIGIDKAVEVIGGLVKNHNSNVI